MIERLRPRKVRNALRRRWFERRMEAMTFADRPGLEALGTDYGAWIVPSELIGAGWVCYCVGMGGDVSFDLELVRRFGARVRACDAVEEFVAEGLAQAAGEPRFAARHVALAATDGPLRMQVSHDERSRSVSSASLYESSEWVELPGLTLSSLMAEFGDERIDLLKIDVEGAEYALLPALDLRGVGVKVLAIQLHHTGTVAQARGLVGRLRAAGYEPVACRAPVRLTFVAGELLRGRVSPAAG